MCACLLASCPIVQPERRHLTPCVLGPPDSRQLKCGSAHLSSPAPGSQSARCVLMCQASLHRVCACPATTFDAPVPLYMSQCAGECCGCAKQSASICAHAMPMLGVTARPGLWGCASGRPRALSTLSSACAQVVGQQPRLHLAVPACHGRDAPGARPESVNIEFTVLAGAGVGGH